MSRQKAENNGYAFCLFKVCATNFGDICHAVGQEATEKFLVCEVLPVVVAHALVGHFYSQVERCVCESLLRCNGSSVLHSSISDILMSLTFFISMRQLACGRAGKQAQSPEGSNLGDVCCHPPHTHTGHFPQSLLWLFPTAFLEHCCTSALLHCKTRGVGSWFPG